MSRLLTERQRKLESYVAIARWLALAAALLTTAGRCNSIVLLVVTAFVSAYNIAVMRFCGNLDRYRQSFWFVGVVARLFDFLLISAALWTCAPNDPGMYLFYLYLVAGVGLVYDWKFGVGAALLAVGVFGAIMSHAAAFADGFLTAGQFCGRGVLLLVTPFLVSLLVRELQREREAHRALSRLEGLYALSGELMREVNIERLLQMIVDLAIEQTDADRGSLMLADPAGEELTIRASRGIPEEIVRSARVRSGEGIAGYVFATGEPVMLGDLGKDPRFSHLVPNDQIVSSLSVPILAQNRTIGVINVSSTGRREPFTENDLRLLVLLAGQAAAAIQNSQMLAELQSLADTDGLTGLFNRRYLDKVLKIECQRAIRYGHPLSALLMDIDDFKNYNDTYGHLEGDDILRELAELIRRGVRATDIPGRYGGEEFLVLLTHTDFEGAKIAAERLRKQIENHTFRVESQDGKKLTISGGVATGYRTYLTPEALIALADAALLRAKSTGKNRIYAAELGMQPQLVKQVP